MNDASLTERILSACQPDGDVDAALVAADYYLERNNPKLAASALDRAHGLLPRDESIARQRRELLDELAVVEHGIRFCYVPAGSFLMGSEAGDPDESPIHPVRTSEFWLSEVPVTWAAYCALLGWAAAPESRPIEETSDVGEGEEENRMAHFHLHEMNKIRMQYCETGTLHASDWHAHLPSDSRRSQAQGRSVENIFGAVTRDDPSCPFEYNVKPMVAVGWSEALDLCEHLSTEDVGYGLPTEAEWEKAARGGLIQAAFAWGDEPPDAGRCDFDHPKEFVIRPPRLFPPNGYGLYGMCGGVWEWTADTYDALAYSVSPQQQEGEPEYVLRGGSWLDCADAVTVSFRMSRRSGSWRSGEWGGHRSPNIGFRLCRLDLSGDA